MVVKLACEVGLLPSSPKQVKFLLVHVLIVELVSKITGTIFGIFVFVQDNLGLPSSVLHITILNPINVRLKLHKD